MRKTENLYMRISAKQKIIIKAFANENSQSVSDYIWSLVLREMKDERNVKILRKYL